MKKQKNAPQILPREEWPYEVPENWVWTRLLSGGAECLDKYRQPVNAAERKNREGNIPYYGATGQVGWIDTYLTDEQLVLLGEDGAPFLDAEKNKAYIIEGPAWVNNHAHILRSLYGNIGNLFLLHYLNQFDYVNYVSGTTRLKLTQAKMNEMPFPLPPLPEQQRIVARIESLFAKFDAAAEKIRAALDAFPTRKAALLHKAFTGELTKKWREEHGVGMESWKETLLKEQTSSIGDGLHGTPIYDEAGEYYFVNGNNLNTTHIEIKNDTKRVNEKEYNKYRVQLSSNTILLSINGTLGNTAFYQDEPIILGKSACYINILPTISKYFLRYYFCSWEFRDYANAKSTGSTIKNLGLKAIRELPIFLPTLPEQQEIVRRLDAILAREQSAKETAEQLLDTIALTKKSILARAFRGLLGTNNPKEASAEGLLRIR